LSERRQNMHRIHRALSPSLVVLAACGAPSLAPSVDGGADATTAPSIGSVTIATVHFDYPAAGESTVLLAEFWAPRTLPPHARAGAVFGSSPRPARRPPRPPPW